MSPKPESEAPHTRIKIKVLPRSSENRIIGKEGEVFKVKLNAPPVEGKANKALIEFLAKKLRIPKGKFEIISGRNSRLKTIRISGVSLEDLSPILEYR